MLYQALCLAQQTRVSVHLEALVSIHLYPVCYILSQDVQSLDK